jgi:hypothetical protein
MLASRNDSANCAAQRNNKSRAFIRYVAALSAQMVVAILTLFVYHKVALGHVHFVTGWTVVLALALTVLWSIAAGTPDTAVWVGFFVAIHTQRYQLTPFGADSLAAAVLLAALICRLWRFVKVKIRRGFPVNMDKSTVCG